MRTKRTSTPIRIDNRILEELRQVVAEKDLRVVSFYGNSKQLRELMESDNYPVMAEVMTKRGLLESVLCGAIDYIRECEDLPRATFAEFDKNDYGSNNCRWGGDKWHEQSQRECQRSKMAYENNWYRNPETPKVERFTVDGTLNPEVHSSETETPKEDSQ